MLVLSRYRDESIIIGNDIVITVVDIRGDKVRLGISAPTAISVHREEVYNAIQRDKGRPSHTGSTRTISPIASSTPPCPTWTRPEDSAALKHQTAEYPAVWRGNVPRRVRITKHVAVIVYEATDASHDYRQGDAVDVIVNASGAVFAIRPGGDGECKPIVINLKPGEFEVIAWHDVPVATRTAQAHCSPAFPTAAD